MALMLRRLRVAALYLPLVVVLLLYYVPLYLPKSISVPDDAPRLTLLNFNIQTMNARLDEIAAIISTADADVVALQVVGETAAVELDTRLGTQYPYRRLHPKSDVDIYGNRYAQGQAILSKYPITSDEFWMYDDLAYTHGQQRVTLNFKGTPIVLYNVHPWPAMDWETWYGPLTFTFTPEEDEAHREGVRRVVARAKAERGAVLIVGDLNMSDTFEEYRLTTEAFTDAFRAAGMGVGFTFPADKPPLPPIIRLDYVFYSAALQATQAETLAEAGPSDHLPLWVELALVES